MFDAETDMLRREELRRMCVFICRDDTHRDILPGSEVYTIHIYAERI